MAGKLCVLALALLASAGTVTSHAAESSGAAASDPTAAVNYQDVRSRYFDLDRGADKQSFETEGAFMLHPRLKTTHELRYVNTDSSGKSEQDFEESSSRRSSSRTSSRSGSRRSSPWARSG